MQMSEKNSGWEDLIFIPPGKSYSQHLQDVVKVWGSSDVTSACPFDNVKIAITATRKLLN